MRRNQPVPVWYGWTKSGKGIHLGVARLGTAQEGFQAFVSFCGLAVTEAHPQTAPLYAPLDRFESWCGNCFRSLAWAALRSRVEALIARRAA